MPMFSQCRKQIVYSSPCLELFRLSDSCSRYRARALSEPRHKSSHEHHAYYYKAEVIVTTTKAIIAGFFSVATL
jgi:hypothetical protein